MIILLFLTLSFHLAIACDKYNITHFIQNDSLTINFLSNNLLKLNRKVQCTSTSSIEEVNGCVHHCNGLGYGQHDRISVEMHYDNGTIDICFIGYITELQSPSLAYLNITNNKVRLGINRPLDSFDYVDVKCSDKESYIIFDTSMPLSNSLATIDCSFLSNTSLMSFVLETVKKGFHSAVNHIYREVPLPIQFIHSLDSYLLTVIAYAPPLINIYSTYEFQLIFYDKNNENISYQRDKISNLISDLGATFKYGLIPNVTYKIIFKHIVNSIGYAESNDTIRLISNISYPFEVTDLRIKEEYQNIILNWNDPHGSYDPIEYIVLCNSSENSMRNIGRNTTYVCKNVTFNEATSISVQTRVAIPGYIHDRIAVTQINVEQIPEIPVFEVSNKTENSITIRWNFTNNFLRTNSFEYKINCGSNHSSIQIDIQSNEYQCQSLVEGTLYVITMSVENLNSTIQRSKSIHANTLLEKCQIQNYLYSPDFNGTRSVIIEWTPPKNNFDKIIVYCPSSYITFEYPQTMPIMFVKCTVTSGIQFNVTFATLKNGYDWAMVLFADIPPMDLTTTTTMTTIPPTTTIPLTTIPPITTISLTTIPPITTIPLTTTATTAVPSPTTATLIITSETTATTRISPTTATQDPLTTSPPVTTPPDNSRDELLKLQAALTRWRTAAIVSFIIIGFLILAIICLTILSVVLHLRNRYNDIDE